MFKLNPSWLLSLILIALGAASPAAAQVSFNVTLPQNAGAPTTGRLIVLVSPDATPEPRLRIGVSGPPAFGTDVDALRPGTSALVDGRADSYPIDLSALPAGTHHAQAVLVRYTRVKRADGHVIWVPITNRLVLSSMIAGNLHSRPVRFTIAPGAPQRVDLALTESIPPTPERVETPWIKHVRIKSELLSRFWGVPMYLGASILLPSGFAENPDATYPAVYLLGHGDAPFGFDTDPASNSLKAQASARSGNLRTGYEFAQEWQSAKFPRMVAITFEHPSPYFVESYAVNSANNGPYGDAITRELIPYLEREFRLIRQPWARVVEGASTGGWEALALHLHYPQMFGGSWVFNPDPIDFSRWQLVDIYQRENMYQLPFGPFRQETPYRRTPEGHPLYSVRQLARLEAVLGSRGRSGYQLGIWQATYGPVGPEGYPKPLWDPRTGVIDKSVANYMKTNGYDLSAYLRTNWARLAPQISGRINLFVGESDDFYQNLAVYQFEDMVRSVGGPEFPIRVEYGTRKGGHNWHHKDWAGVVREMASHVRTSAPPGTDHSRWHY